MRDHCDWVGDKDSAPYFCLFSGSSTAVLFYCSISISFSVIPHFIVCMCKYYVICVRDATTDNISID